MKCAGCNGPLQPVAYCEKCRGENEDRRDAQNDATLKTITGVLMSSGYSTKQIIEIAWQRAIESERGKL